MSIPTLIVVRVLLNGWINKMTSKRMLARLRRSFSVIAIVVLALTAPLLPQRGAAWAAELSIPEIAGTTTITFDGTSGIRLRVPRDVTLTANDFEFTMTGEAAFGHLSPLDATCRGGFESDESSPMWCFDYGFILMDGWMFSPYLARPNNDALLAGRIDLYMVTQGTVTVTFTVPELDGEVTYNASGIVDGEIVRHPVNCLAEDVGVTGCEKQGWGGQQFTQVSPTAVVGSASFTQRPNNLPATGDPSPGTIGVGSCVYPSSSLRDPHKSPDPADHPTGCDVDETGALNFRDVYVTAAVNPLAVTHAHIRKELVTTPGPFYTGFAAHQVESAESMEGPGKYGSYGFWYSREIRCPSGSWLRCDAG